MFLSVKSIYQLWSLYIVLLQESQAGGLDVVNIVQQEDVVGHGDTLRIVQQEVVGHSDTLRIVQQDSLQIVQQEVVHGDTASLRIVQHEQEEAGSQPLHLTPLLPQ